MAGHAQAEGLARPRPTHDQGDAGAALADIPDHGGLVVAGSGVGGQGGPDGVMANHGRPFAGAVDRGGDQLLFHAEEFGGGPAALFQRPLGHHGHRPVGQEPVGQPLQLGAAGAGQPTANRRDQVLVAEGRGLCG
jgi:hypothetical protein